jgi:hypothetical protein
MNQLFKYHFAWIVLLAWLGMAQAQDRLYVVQVLDESLARIDPGTGHVSNHLLELGYGCNDVLAAGGKLYVTNSSLNSVQEIDLPTETTLRQLPTTGGVNPYASALINADTLAVTCWVTNNVVLLRLSDGQPVGTLSAGSAPEGILVYGDFFFVCVTGFLSPGNFAPGCVRVYNRHTLQLVDSIRVGTNPQSAAVDSAGRLHVICTGNYANIAGEVDIVNLSDFNVDTVLHVGGTPASVCFAGDYAWLAAGGWGTEGYVYGYRLSTFAVMSNAVHPVIVGSGATDVEGLSDGSFFVSCFSQDRVEHHAANGTLLGTYLMSDGPGQMVLVISANSVPRQEAVLPQSVQLLEAYPNPFNGTVRLRFSLNNASYSYINIYNISGQLVSKLSIRPGLSEVLWSPMNDNVTILSSSIYYAILANTTSLSATRLIYIR